MEKARKAVAKRMADLFGQITTCREVVDLESFRAELSCLEKYYQLCKEEFHLTRDLSESMEHIGKEIESYRHIYEHLVILQQLLAEHRLLLVEADHERSDSAEVGNRSEEQQYKIETVYEYHADWIYAELQKLGLPLPIKERGRFQTKAELKIS